MLLITENLLQSSLRYLYAVRSSNTHSEYLVGPMVNVKTFILIYFC